MKIRAVFAGLFLALASPGVAATPPPPVVAEIDKIYADWQSAAHVPGLVYGIVADGRLVYVKGRGVQDVATRAPVTPDTLFRIASMSKAFTALAILKLRDEGKLSLDAPAETYVPQMRGWHYPTSDSPKITVRNLLTHSAGFVEDNPWGDRQQVMPEAEFTAMLAAACRSPARRGWAWNIPTSATRPRADRQQCLGGAIRGLYPARADGAAGHGLDRL